MVLNRKNTKLLIIHPALAPYRIDFLNAIGEKSDTEILFLSENPRYQKYDQKKLLSMLKVRYKHMLRGFSVFGRAFRFGIKEEILNIRPDVVVTSEYSIISLWVGLLKLFNRKYRHIIWCDDNPFVIREESIFRKISRSLLLHRVDGLILTNNDIKNYYKKTYNYEGRIAVCPIVHDEQKLRVKIASIEDGVVSLIRSHSLENKHVILYVGRLVNDKRVDRLLKAFANIRKERVDNILIIVGEGSERKKLGELAKNLGIEKHLVFVGHVEGEELLKWYRCASLFVLPSQNELWGAVVGEALACGVPVICSEKAGAKALIQEGINGSIIETSQERALGKAITTWLGMVKPINSKEINQIKPSLLKGAFQAAVEEFVDLMGG